MITIFVFIIGLIISFVLTSLYNTKKYNNFKHEKNLDEVRLKQEISRLKEELNKCLLREINNKK